MADVTPAAPAAPAASNPADAASQEVIKKLPNEQKAPVQAAASEVDDDGSDLPAEDQSAKQKKAEAAAKKAYKLKVNGRDLEVDEAELLKRAQMGYSADQRWQETAQMRKQMDAFIHLIQTDPAKALAQMGHDVDKLAEDR